MKRFALATAAVTGLVTVTITALVLLGANVASASAVAVGIWAGVAILVWLASIAGLYERGSERATGRRVLGITVIATSGVGTFIAIHSAQLIPGNSYLGLFVAQLTLVLALIAIVGAGATGFAVVRWNHGRARRWGVRTAVAMAVYLALVGAVLGQVYVLALAAGYGFGAYRSTRPVGSEAAAP